MRVNKEGNYGKYYKRKRQSYIGGRLERGRYCAFSAGFKKLELPEDFDMSELEEDESDEDFDLWYAGLKKRRESVRSINDNKNSMKRCLCTVF